MYLNTTQPVEIKAVTLDSISVVADAYYHGAKSVRKWSFKGTIDGAVSFTSGGMSATVGEGGDYSTF